MGNVLLCIGKGFTSTILQIDHLVAMNDPTRL
jgi:hypothetical protein